MNTKGKIYFQIYKKLEEEVLELTSEIHFVDEHLNVFSIKIADLITRCSIEIESIIKDIYRVETKKEPKTVSEALIWIEDNWKISKKKVKIYSKYFYFNNEIMEFAPFNYEKGSRDDYYSTYNAIKHDRNKNIAKADIYTLLRVLAALYILNIYFENRRIHLYKDRYGEKMDKSGGSSIFNFYVAPCEKLVRLSSEINIDRKFCIYEIIKYEHNLAFQIKFINLYDEIELGTMTNASDEFQNFAKSKLYKEVDLEDFNYKMSKLMYNSSHDFIDNFKVEHKVKKIISIKSKKMKPAYFAELVKS